MTTLLVDQQVPLYSLGPQDVPGSHLFRLTRTEGAPGYPSDMLFPHRKDYYMLVFLRRGGGRHWVDMTPYDAKDNTFYILRPGQLQIKEKVGPMWCTSLSFTKEFLALQHAAWATLPLLQNAQQGHELRLTTTDVAVVEDLLAKLAAEYLGPQGEWRQRMLAAHLEVLLIYLSRLYLQQFPADEEAADKRLLQQYRAKIEECFRERHDVGAYAALLHVTAGHLGEVVKAQSGKPAIAHIQERLVLEARRLLFHTDNPVKEIAFDLGFADASYFTRFFKRETGTPPASYRASIRKMYR